MSDTGKHVMTSIPYRGMYSCVTRIIVEYGPNHSMMIGDPESLVAICDHSASLDPIAPESLLSTPEVRSEESSGGEPR